jgi:ABC-type dipeptide/oligopeptide/nickel transport system permease component
VIISVSFFIMRLAPGGPFDQDRALPKQVRANIEARYLDRSVNELLGLGWLPVAGWGTWRHMILPSLALGAFYAA